jgi:copper(I)-binding protein
MKNNSALWHAKWGSRMIKVPNNNESKVFSFVRQNEDDKIFAVFNFSDESKTVEFKEPLYHGKYSRFKNNEDIILDTNSTLELKPWEYQIYVQ